MKHTPVEELLIGAHTSAAGGAFKALLEGQEIGATTIQLFTSNQKRWEGKVFKEEDLEKWQQTLKETGMKKIMSHGSYLVNLGSPNSDALKKSRHAFKEELIRCQQLGISFLNFHPGAALEGPVDACLDRIIESLKGLESQLEKGHTRLLLENTAGQGSSVGHQFEQLGYIIDHLHHKIPVGICIDTCHLFVAGYDIRTQDDWDKTLKKLDEIVGLRHLYAIHVNDSMKPLGSRRDRHAALGKGEIGIDSFKAMMTHPKLRDLPKYLETPEGPPLWKKEIHMLREFAKS